MYFCWFFCKLKTVKLHCQESIIDMRCPYNHHFCLWFSSLLPNTFLFIKIFVNEIIFIFGWTEVNLFAFVFYNIFIIFWFGIIKIFSTKFFWFSLKFFEIITFHKSFLGSIFGDNFLFNFSWFDWFFVIFIITTTWSGITFLTTFFLFLVRVFFIGFSSSLLKRLFSIKFFISSVVVSFFLFFVGFSSLTVILKPVSDSLPEISLVTLFQLFSVFPKYEIFNEKRLFLLILEEANNQIQNFIEFSGVKKGNDNKCRFLRSIFYCPQKSMFYVDMIKNKSSLNYTHKLYYLLLLTHVN